MDMSEQPVFVIRMPGQVRGGYKFFYGYFILPQENKVEWATFLSIKTFLFGVTPGNDDRFLRLRAAVSTLPNIDDTAPNISFSGITGKIREDKGSSYCKRIKTELAVSSKPRRSVSSDFRSEREILFFIISGGERTTRDFDSTADSSRYHCREMTKWKQTVHSYTCKIQ